MNKKLTAIESFCGPGGIALGLRKAGYNIISAFDYDEKTVETYRKNIGDHIFQADANNVTFKMLQGKTGIKKRELDLFAGGPPCQGFSKQKRGAHLGDDRNDLVLQYARLVKELEPKFFLFENVAVFGQKRGLKYLEEMAKRLDNYALYPQFYNAADYGLAQTRERFIMVGRRKDIKCSFSFPPPTHKTWRTVGEVLAGLPEPPKDYSDHPDFPNHQKARVTEINIHRFSFVPPGGGWQDIPKKFQIPSHQRADTRSGGWPDVYGRLRSDGQCPTITGGFDSFTRGRYGHPKENRPLTPREAARLQGFPDTFVFQGTRGDVRSQIGNAVPPPLAQMVAAQIKRSLMEYYESLEAKPEPTYPIPKKSRKMVLQLAEETRY